MGDEQAFSNPGVGELFLSGEGRLVRMELEREVAPQPSRSLPVNVIRGSLADMACSVVINMDKAV